MNDQLRQAAINAGVKFTAMRDADQAFSDAYTLWEDAHADLVVNKTDTRIEYNMALEALRKAVLAEYEATGAKHPGAGTGIRVSQKVVTDEPQALKWAETNAPVFVRRTLDRKAFDDYAKKHAAELGALVRIDEEVTPTIPSDLLSALEAAGLTLPEPPDMLAWGQAFINELTEPEPPDLLGAEPETGRLPADPRPGYTKLGELLAFPDEHSFEPMDTDALERVDAGGTEGIIKAMEGGLA